MQTGVTFINSLGTFHTFRDFGIRQLADVTLGTPEAQTHIVQDVPGVDGQIDLTEMFGRIRYGNRQILLSFDMEGDYTEWMGTVSTVVSAIHGQMCRVIFDVDPEHYYEGRVTVNDCEKTSLVDSEMSIEISAAPYRRSMIQTVETYAVPAGPSTISVNFGPAPVHDLVVRSESGVSLMINGVMYLSSDMEIPIPDEQAGATDVEISSETAQTVAFTFTGGSL